MTARVGTLRLALVALAACGSGAGRDAIDGGADAAPIDAGVDLGPTRYPADRIASPITAAVAARVRAIAAAGPNQHADAFMKVGASGTVSTNFLFCFAGASQPSYTLDLAGRDALLPTIAYFRGGHVGTTNPFDRPTLAAQVGKTARWVQTGAPAPLDQELALAQPRYAFVNYGTNDMEAAATYGAALPPFWDAMNELLDHLEAAGVVPIITGLNPRSDDPIAARWVPTWDAVTRALAEARQLPYVSLFVASDPLAGHGLGPDGLHGTAYTTTSAQPCVFTPAALAFNYNLRNLASITALATTRTVLDGGAAPDAPPLPPIAGAGTAADPFLIDAVPFTHTFTTLDGESARARYPACDAGQDESGPEITYQLDLPAPTAIRAIVLDGATVDVDVHVLTSGTCVERADHLLDRILPAGRHTIVVDTFVSAGVAQSGSYTLVLVPCAAGDTDCT